MRAALLSRARPGRGLTRPMAATESADPLGPGSGTSPPPIEDESTANQRGELGEPVGPGGREAALRVTIADVARVDERLDERLHEEAESWT